MGRNRDVKNILFIMPTLGGGGAEKVLLNILNNIDYKRFNVTLLLLCKKGRYINKLNKNVNLKSIYDPNRYKNRYINGVYYRTIMFLYNNLPRILYTILIGNRNDSEIAFLEGEPVKFLSNSSNKKSKKIAWIHIDIKILGKDRLKKDINYYKNIDEIICVSNDSAKVFKDIYPQYKKKVQVVYNLIDSKEIISKANELIDYKYENNSIISIGRLENQKRFDLLIKAHRLLLDDGIQNELIILGEGSKKEELLKLIEKLNVSKSVKLMGFKSNPYPYLKRADVFAMSSDFEGLPLVICEAMILGKAIVSTDCTGPKEIIDDGNYGVMCKRNDEIQLKECLKKILLDTTTQKYYQQKSIERSKIFNLRNTMEKIYSIIY